MGEFWARRARRLLPAAFLVLLVSALAVYVFLPALARVQNFTEIAFASIYILNWRLAADSVDYLAADNAASVAQHYWSLSVEEQFYIVWPVLILVALWCAAKSRRFTAKQAVTIALLIVFVLSLVFSIYETARSQPSAYFITTTRAWEFAAGGLVAMLPLARLRELLHVSLSWLALGAIVGSAVLFDAQTAFPGWIALVPILGAAMLLWLGDSDSKWTPQYLAKAGPVQLVGDTSYAIYLWHWPLIVVAAALLGRSPGWKWAIILAVATVLLALATKYLVEDPIRRAPGVLKRQLPTFGFMAAGMAVTLLVTVVPAQVIKVETERFQQRIASGIEDSEGCFGAYSILNNCPDPFDVTETVNPTATETDIHWAWFSKDNCTNDLVRGQFYERSCTFRYGGEQAQRMLLIGDSHAEHFTAPFEIASQELGWDLDVRTRAGCTMFDAPAPNASEDVQRCAEWNREILTDTLADADLDIVILSYRASNKADVSANAVATIQELRRAGKEVLILREVPGLPPQSEPDQPLMTGPICVADSDLEHDPCSWQPAERSEWLIDAAIASGAKVVDPWEVLCSPDGKCHTVIGGTIAYMDNNHLALPFAQTMWSWIRDQLNDSAS